MPLSLEAVFGVDASGVRAEIKSLRKDLNSFVNDYAKLGVGVAVGAFVALSKGAIDLAGHLSDTSANLGINVESLQALEAQHKRNGVSQEQLTKALEKTKAAVLAAADGDKKATESLAQLGLKAEDLIRLPLDEQYEAIAKAAANAADQNQAYSAVSAILGEKVGPKLMSSLRELAEEGLPKVTQQAREAGQVMSAETIAQLDKAGDAIDDFKKKATVAIGTIIVNFRSAEGLELLLFQFLKIVGQFGAGIIDAIYEAGGMITAVFTGTLRGVINFFRDGFIDAIALLAEKFNSIMPDFMKEHGFVINVAGLDALKSAGKSVSEEISDAIAHTSPGTFKKEVGEFWDQRIAEQKKLVDAMNAKDFGAEADKLRNAGKDAAVPVSKAAAEVKDAGDKAGKAIKDAGVVVAVAGDSAGDSIKAALAAGASALSSSMNAFRGVFEMVVTESKGVRVGKHYTADEISAASDAALKEIINRSNSKIAELKTADMVGSPSFANALAVGQVGMDRMAAQRELDLRQTIRDSYGRGGTAAVYSALPMNDPIVLDRLIDQFAKNLPQAERTTSAVEDIARRVSKLLPSSNPPPF